MNKRFSAHACQPYCPRFLAMKHKFILFYLRELIVSFGSVMTARQEACNPFCDWKTVWNIWLKVKNSLVLLVVYAFYILLHTVSLIDSKYSFDMFMYISNLLLKLYRSIYKDVPPEELKCLVKRLLLSIIYQICQTPIIAAKKTLHVFNFQRNILLWFNIEILLKVVNLLEAFLILTDVTKKQK